jgi:hypothetical protein
MNIITDVIEWMAQRPIITGVIGAGAAVAAHAMPAKRKKRRKRRKRPSRRKDQGYGFDFDGRRV